MSVMAGDVTQGVPPSPMPYDGSIVDVSAVGGASVLMSPMHASGYGGVSSAGVPIDGSMHGSFTEAMTGAGDVLHAPKHCSMFSCDR
jgi:hypothetical protein